MLRSCSQCQQSFQIMNVDLDFYEKVSPVFSGKKYLIPPPTLCPDCRVQRRMAWRNDRTFYKRKSDLSGKGIISIYPEKTPFPVYHQSEWYGDRWDPMDYGQPLDLNRPFLEQFGELMMKVPRLGMDLINCQNSDYCNYCGDDKNCYLDIAGEANEDCYFDLFTKYSKNCVDCTFVYRSTLCYECIQCYNCYNVRYSQYMDDCGDCAFCFDCKGCRNCLLSINQRNKEYCVLNVQYSREEYEKKLRELNLGSYASVERADAYWHEQRIKHRVYRDMYMLNCEDCDGNDIKNSKNCHLCFNAINCEDSKYLYDVLDAKDCQDMNYSLYKPEVAYEICSTLNMRFSAFNYASHYCSNMYYCEQMNNSADVFGCNALNHKQYCILNKQYTKEEYEQLVPRVIERMKRDGEWGEFFPASLSPFGYDETVAQEYMPLTEPEARERGFNWKDAAPVEAVSNKQSAAIPDSINDIDEGVCDTILYCEITRKPYKITAQELKFYRQQSIPIPRRSPEQRHKDRNNRRNRLRLWDRACAKCGKAIRTGYAPDRPEKVYCEECYRKEVY